MNDDTLLIEEVVSKIAHELGMSNEDALSEFKTSQTYGKLGILKEASVSEVYDMYVDEFTDEVTGWFEIEEE